MNRLKINIATVLILFSSICYSGEWYKGGNLTDKNTLKWQDATLANKLASSSDFVALMYQKQLLKSSVSSHISDVNDIAPYAIQLAACIDETTKKHAGKKQNSKTFTNQSVASVAAVCMTLMGWTK